VTPTPPPAPAASPSASPGVPPVAPPVPDSAFKSRGGLQRIVRAAGYSIAGLRAAWRHEAAFRQELVLGVPLAALAPWIAPSRWAALAMVASIVLVWIVELLNSALEALADQVSTEHRPLLGRAKDLGSAAVMLCLLLVGATWSVALWP
jgi:diacylglycerol kinase (ATP)